MSPEGEITFRVRYPECDPMGVAHHAAYPVWFELGRTELCRESGISYREIEAAGAFLAVTALNVRYRRPARYDDLVRLRTVLARRTHVKLEHTYELLHDGILLATGATTLACLDGDGRPKALPDILRD